MKNTLRIVTALLLCHHANAMDFEACMAQYESERTCRSMAALQQSSPDSVSVMREDQQSEFESKLRECVRVTGSESGCRKSMALNRMGTEGRMQSAYTMRKRMEAEQALQQKEENWKTNCGGVATAADLQNCFGEPDYVSRDADGSSYYSYRKDGVTKHFHMEYDVIRSASEDEIKK